MKDVGGAGFAGSSPSLLGRERAAVNVDVGPERRSPRYHETFGGKCESNNGSADGGKDGKMRLVLPLSSGGHSPGSAGSALVWRGL